MSIIKFLLVIFCWWQIIGLGNFFQNFAWAETKTLLTLETLQTRIEEPIQKEGINTIDLTNFLIDLNDKNLEFSQQFYQQLQTKLIRSNKPIVLDFSQSFIKGKFEAKDLGISTRLAEGALSSLLNPLEQETIKEYSQLSLQPGEQIPTVNVIRGGLKFEQTEFTDQVDFTNSFCLQKIIASEARFGQESNWHHSIFVREIDFSNTRFQKEANFSYSNFGSKVKFVGGQFLAQANFNNSYFQNKLDFQSASFGELLDFNNSTFAKLVNLSKSNFKQRVIFIKSKFQEPLLMINSIFEGMVDFRDTFFQNYIDLQDAIILEQINLSNAVFAPQTRINVSGLGFDSDAAKIIGETGIIGKIINVPILEGNEIILRNLIRNFRRLEQIPDANQLEYKREKLRLKQLGNQIIAVSWQNIFSLSWLSKILAWLGLSLVLLLGNYGTNFSLVFAVGLIAIAYFSFLFWFVDRYRRLVPKPILPNRYEIICIVSSYFLLTIFGIIEIFQATDRPWLTLACLAIILLPIPALLLIRLYSQGRYHNLLDLTYFVEDGSMRQFRLMLGRLPIIPRFPFFRDRYEPILWERRWNWLNYYDLSLNNLLKFGFNDIRLRDRDLPGIVATLVWYQWALGVLYITLLLWTLSRTIPGLNLLIYF
ncbi:hypothetical protein STA3757_15170 [Stanieria sp. NIES-3757]|nr:hypothetical protein STA3757_15170 [Stanieria sp. NIES-3757]